MIIKTETAIVDIINTYFIEYRESKKDYRLLAVSSKYNTDIIPLYTANDKTFVEDMLDDIYRRFNKGSNSCIDLGV